MTLDNTPMKSMYRGSLNPVIVILLLLSGGLASAGAAAGTSPAKFQPAATQGQGSGATPGEAEQPMLAGGFGYKDFPFRRDIKDPNPVALKLVNEWLDGNPKLKVVNIETLSQTSGAIGGSFSSQVGFRVWFEKR